MANIDVQSTIDVDSSKAIANLNTIRAIDSLMDVDSSKAILHDDYTQILKAIQSLIDADYSEAIMEANCHKAIHSLLDTDTSKASVKLNLIKALEDSINPDNSQAILSPTIYRAIEGTIDVDSSKAIASLNQYHAMTAEVNGDESKAEIQYLFLKNPPLPPHGGISVRSINATPLKNSPTLIANSTHVLDVYIVGERLASLHLVFTVRSMQNGQLVPHIQKSSKDTPNSYLQLTGGKGDILIQSISPSVSARGISQDLSATIMLLPHDFQRLPNKAGTYQYDLWVYDLLGTNALIESGTIKVVS